MGSAVLDLLGMKPGPPEELSHARGDLAEKELVEEIKKVFDAASDKEVVVYQGPRIRVPGKLIQFYQEKDVVIINKKTKTVYNIESKSKLAERPGNKAVKQTLKLKVILEEFFALEFASNDWCFVGLIYTKEINPNNTFCADCFQFIIHGPSEVAAKLNNIETHHLKKVRPQPVVPSHDEYVSIVTLMVLVVLNQPLSTYCTITRDVQEKVVCKGGQG